MDSCISQEHKHKRKYKQPSSGFELGSKISFPTITLSAPHKLYHSMEKRNGKPSWNLVWDCLYSLCTKLLCERHYNKHHWCQKAIWNNTNIIKSSFSSDGDLLCWENKKIILQNSAIISYFFEKMWTLNMKWSVFFSQTRHSFCLTTSYHTEMLKYLFYDTPASAYRYWPQSLVDLYSGYILIFKVT